MWRVCSHISDFQERKIKQPIDGALMYLLCSSSLVSDAENTLDRCFIILI